jgi:hypothetical protein
VHFVVAPGVICITWASNGDETSLTTTSHNIVLKDNILRAANINASIEVMIGCLHFDPANNFSSGYKIASDAITISFVENTIVDEAIDDIVLDWDVV